MRANHQRLHGGHHVGLPDLVHHRTLRPGVLGNHHCHANVAALLHYVAVWLSRLFAIVIICAEFKLSSVMEHFKFLQFVPGLSAFYLLYLSSYFSMAAIFSFEFSTYDEA